jgi:hypothetical protein
MKSVHTVAKHCGTNPSRHLSTSPANVTNKSVSASDFDVIGLSDAPHSPARNNRGPNVCRARVAHAETRPRRQKRIRPAFSNEPNVVPNPDFRSHAVAERSQGASRTAFAPHHRTNPTRLQDTAERTHRSRTTGPARTASPNEANAPGATASRSAAKRTHLGSRVSLPQHYRTNPAHRGNRKIRLRDTAERTHRGSATGPVRTPPNEPNAPNMTASRSATKRTHLGSRVVPPSITKRTQRTAPRSRRTA